MKAYIVIIIVLPILFVASAAAIIWAIQKELDKHTFVYPKTGNKYVTLYDIKMKDPSTGEWKDAIVYKGMTGDYYVRETRDFFNKFVKLHDWTADARK